MDENTTAEFTQSLAIILAAYVDATNKVKALELALKEHNPVFYALYLGHLETVKNGDDSGMQVALALERLQGFLEK